MTNIQRTILVLCFTVCTGILYGGTRGGVHDISTAASFNINKGIEPNIFYFDLVYSYKNRFGTVKTGIQATSANTDTLVQLMYTPLAVEKHTIGIGALYHLSVLYDIGTIHDLLIPFEYTFTLPDKFVLFTQVGYLHQWIAIPVPGQKTIVIGQPSMTAAFHLTGIIKKEWYLGAGMSSYELFRYPVFANPSINCSVYYRSKGIHVRKGFYIGLETALRYSDLFTLSGYPENFIIKSVIGMEL